MKLSKNPFYLFHILTLYIIPILPLLTLSIKPDNVIYEVILYTVSVMIGVYMFEYYYTYKELPYLDKNPKIYTFILRAGLISIPIIAPIFLFIKYYYGIYMLSGSFFLLMGAYGLGMIPEMIQQSCRRL